MAQMSATYYSFTSSGGGHSGGTERRVVLCPDGRYYSGSESGYSSGAGTGGCTGYSKSKGQPWDMEGHGQCPERYVDDDNLGWKTDRISLSILRERLLLLRKQQVCR
jgi:hypothetical protein